MLLNFYFSMSQVEDVGDGVGDDLWRQNALADASFKDHGVDVVLR